MKKILFALLLLGATQLINAQGRSKDTIDSTVDDAPVYNTDFNRWSIELGAGGNKPIDPFTPGYSSSDQNKFLNFGKVDHFEAGIRYMLTNKFGLKLDGALDKITNLEGSSSPVFETQQIRVGLQGVINLGRLLSFEQFTSRIGFLAHFGIQVSQLTPKTGTYANVAEYNGGLMYGFTPQIRITNRVVAHLDVTMMNNVRQHFSWDGQSNASEDNSVIKNNNLTGRMINSSVGLTVYLGGHDVHADWYADEAKIAPQQPQAAVEDTTRGEELFGILARLDELEKCQNDSDKDGVNDCIDEEENTKEGAFVDTKGRTIEKPKNGVDGKAGVDGTTTIIKQAANPTVIQKGSLLNIFYDVNKDVPNAASVGDVSLITGYMIANPESKIRLIGYADTRGGSATNLALSQRRAKNLTAMVVAKGINANRVRFDGFGVDRKVANPTKEEMDYARRTEVIVE
jgi:OmpA-OmpF porin, OOP family